MRLAFHGRISTSRACLPLRVYRAIWSPGEIQEIQTRRPQLEFWSISMVVSHLRRCCNHRCHLLELVRQTRNIAGIRPRSWRGSDARCCATDPVYLHLASASSNPFPLSSQVYSSVSPVGALIGYNDVGDGISYPNGLYAQNSELKRSYPFKPH